MDDHPLVVQPSPEKDPDGSRLRTVLESHQAYERACNARLVLVHMMLLPGAALWVAVSWPALVGERMRGFASYSFALGCVALLYAAASERRWLRIRNRLGEDLKRPAQNAA